MPCEAKLGSFEASFYSPRAFDWCVVRLLTPTGRRYVASRLPPIRHRPWGQPGRSARRTRHCPRWARTAPAPRCLRAACPSPETLGFRSRSVARRARHSQAHIVTCISCDAPRLSCCSTGVLQSQRLTSWPPAHTGAALDLGQMRATRLCESRGVAPGQCRRSAWRARHTHAAASRDWHRNARLCLLGSIQAR